MLRRSSVLFPRVIVTLALLTSLIVSAGVSSLSPLSQSSAVASVASQAVGDDTYKIKLRSREFTPAAGLSSLERSRLQANARSVLVEGGSRIHTLIQLYDIPSPEQKAAYAAQGIQLLNYIPNRTWVASLAAGDFDRVAATSGVRWLGELHADDKLSPQIRADQYADWHYDAARDIVAAVIELHEDVELNVARELVLDAGGMVRSYVESINGVMAEVPRDALRALAADDRVLWVEAALPALTPANDGARAALNVDLVQAAPYNLDGTGIDVLVYDGGQVDSSHPDFAGRITIGAGDASSLSDHATHVAGTVGADGSQSLSAGGTANQWRGMAPGVDIVSYGYEYDGTGTFFYTNLGDIQNDWNAAKNTYGADLGTASLSTNLYSNSTIDPVNFQCAFEGDYGAASQLLDNIVRGSLGEPYITTWANGNERSTATCGSQYNTTPPPACAKNPIHVGATNSNNNSMASFSSWGPCDDGRLKPIITAPGCQSTGDFALTSTVANAFIDVRSRNCDGAGDDFCYPYDTMCGTSMATPATAGVIALMLEQYRATLNTAGELLPSSAKALLMNSATDLGNAGPDYQFGYGHVDAQAAVDAIVAGHFREASIGATGEVDWYVIDVPAGAALLQVSLAWDDPGVAPLSAPALINDLNLALLDPSGGLQQPWVLNAASPANAATTGTDTLNNQEQVTVNAPAAGKWRVRVTGTTVPNAPQSYSLAATHNMISMAIANPTNATPANVGYRLSPEKLLISLDLRDREGGPLGTTIDSSTDLAFSIGGTAPVSVFPGGNVGNFYWVLVTPPTQSAAGCFDLQVTLYGLSDLTDLEAGAVCYTDTPTANEDVMLVIDSSGSMAVTDKMPATRDAAKFFVTATALGDMIGMDTFSTTAALMFPLTAITGTVTQNAVNQEIDDLVAFGWTAMGAGAQIANTELTANGDPAHQHTMVLLSDGRENQIPMWASVVGGIPAGTVIHTVALGPDGDPDEPLLSGIAASFSGNYYRVPTGSSLRNARGATSLATDLSNVLGDVYRSAAEETYGWERLWESSGLIGESGPISVTHGVSVENGLFEAIFAVHWAGGVGGIAKIPLILEDPLGAQIGPGSPGVEYREVRDDRRGTGHAQFRVPTPMGGVWKIMVFGSQTTDSEYLALLEARSPSNLLLMSPLPGQHIGFCQHVPLLAAFMGPSQAILSATVQAELVGPLASVRTTLFDDGNHGDGQANDGWYGNLFRPKACDAGATPDDGAGSYQIRISAQGINEDDEPVLRSKTGAYYATRSTTGDPDPPPAAILLVDDDENAPDVRTNYAAALNANGIVYDVWDVLQDGPVSAGNLIAYDTVIWFTGDDVTSTLAASDEAALMAFLDAGGRLFLSSQLYFTDAGLTTFMQDYLHVSAGSSQAGITSVTGVTGNAVGDGLGPYALSPAAGFADLLTPAGPGGQSAFVNQSDSTAAVSFTDGSFCTLFASFPFERLPAGGAQAVMESFVNWPCWNPDIVVAPLQVDAGLVTGARTVETTLISNPGQGKLAWSINSGPIHLWTVTDQDGQVPTFIRNLDPTTFVSQSATPPRAPFVTMAITDDVSLDVCAVTNGVSDCCTGATCTADELLARDVLLVFSNQAFAGATVLGDMLADFVDQGGAVIVAGDALVEGTGGLGGRFMSENYSPLKSASAASAGAASLGSFDAAHPLMSGVSTAGVLSHLDVFTTGGDIKIVGSWGSGEQFVALKRRDPAPAAGRVVAVNAPLDDGAWSGDVNEIVTNAIQWLSDNLRDPTWFDAVCTFSPPTPLPGNSTLQAAATAYGCPQISSGGDWALSLALDGSGFDWADVANGLVFRGKVTINHNVSDKERVNIPVTASVVPQRTYLPTVIR